MKTKDLMIGDWVQVDVVKGDDLVLVKRKVAGINMKRAIVTIDDGVEMFAAFLLPIPLTTEILEKNGFIGINEYRRHYTISSDLGGYTHFMPWCENYFVAMTKVRDNCWEIHIQGDSANLTGGVTCVHELQHALKLCGIDKEIKL